MFSYCYDKKKRGVIFMKQYLYTREPNTPKEQELKNASVYGKVRIGTNYIFWKKGFKWYSVELNKIQRIYRRVEHVYGKLCGGGDNYDIERLMLILKDGEQVEPVIGDRMEKEAIALMEYLQTTHPEIQYGKE